MQTSSYSVSEFSSFAEMPSSCRELMQAAESQSLFLGLTWFEIFAATVVEAGSRLRIVVLSESQSGIAVAVFPLWQAKRRPQLNSLSNYYSSFYAPVIAESVLNDEERLSRLFDEFLTHFLLEQNVISLDLRPLQHPAAWVEQLATAAKRHGLYSQSYFCFGNWYLPVTGNDAASYLAMRPSRLRNTLKRKHNQLQAQGGYQIRIITKTDELAQAYPQYQKIYQNSWKRDESHPAFIEHLLYDFAARGQLRLGLLDIKGEAAAAQIWLVVNTTASIYKLAYDEKFAAFSVGSLLTQAMFSHVLEREKLGEIDFLSGDDAYKKDWMSQRRERWGVLLINRRTPLGFLLYLRHSVPARFKQWLAKGDASAEK